uniref:Zinc finger, CCHC-type n=1 Tax=Tanacetum cinerariifolium TaxID=118510 RepID=A0A6L2NTZ4_TANCI|nr:zinc finger, CCHC-type [Tanacetum cinerariifolium]
MEKKDAFLAFKHSVMYVPTTPMSDDGGDNPIVDQNVETSKELWDTLKAKYMAEDASSKKFLVSNFTNYKRTDSRTVLEQYNELLGILGRYKDNMGKRKHHDTKADPNKKPKMTSWKCRKPRHLKKDCKAGNVGNKANGSGTKGLVDGSSNPLKDRCWFKTYESLNDGSILHMGNESIALVHGRGYVDLRLNIVSDNIGSAFISTSKLNDSILWHARLGHVYFKRMQDMSKDGLIPGFDMDTEKVWGCRAVVRLPNPKLKNLGERGIKCIFVGYAEHSKAFVVLEKVTDEIVQQSEPELRKIKRHRNPKDFGPEFQFYLIEGTRDEISDQHSYCFNVEDDPKIFDEIFKRKLKVDGTVEKFKARLVIQGFKQKSRIYYFDTYASVARISTIRLLLAMASIHSLIIHQMDVKTAFLKGKLEKEVYMNQPLGFILPGNENKPDIAFVVGKLSRYTSNSGTQHWQAIQRVLKYLKKTIDYRLVYSGYPSVLEGYTDASWISNSEDNSSKSGWVLLLGGAAGKETEWLKNLLLEILLWVKLMAPISIRCDSAATLAKAYSQMYNGKSSHLDVRHSMIRELITNGVISIEFVRSQQNLADQLMKGLARDLVIKSTEGMELKSN